MKTIISLSALFIFTCAITGCSVGTSSESEVVAVPSDSVHIVADTSKVIALSIDSSKVDTIKK